MNKLNISSMIAEARELGGFLMPVLHIVLILVLAWVALKLARKLIAVFKEYLHRQSDELSHRKRVDTLGNVFSYLAKVLVIIIAGMLVLSALGVSIAPILATAGVAGIAIGFGAQSLVKDYFNGFFLLMENQIRVGDVVEVAGKGGSVEAMTLRHTRLRDYEGNVHFIPNGAIDLVTNRSRLFAYALMDIGIAYREDVEEAFEVMRSVAREMRADGDFGPRILEDIDIAGVDQWADSAVVLRCRLKVKPLEQWAVRREYLRRLKHAFDAQGIEIPYPHLTIYAGEDKKGNAPAFRLQQAEVRASGAAR